MTDINALLDKAGDEPASYTKELIELAAAIYAVDLGNDHPSVVRLRRSARSLGFIVGLDAEQEWERLRGEIPWWRRWQVRPAASETFKAEFIAAQRERARRDVAS